MATKNILEGKDLTITNIKKMLDGKKGWHVTITWMGGNETSACLRKNGRGVVSDYGEGFLSFSYQDCKVARSIKFNRPE